MPIAFTNIASKLASRSSNVNAETGIIFGTLYVVSRNILTAAFSIVRNLVFVACRRVRLNKLTVPTAQKLINAAESRLQIFKFWKVTLSKDFIALLSLRVDLAPAIKIV